MNSFRKKIDTRSKVDSISKSNNSFILKEELEKKDILNNPSDSPEDSQDDEETPTFQCETCQDKKLIRNRENPQVWEKCICTRKEYVRQLLSDCTSYRDPDLRFWNPSQLLNFANLAFVQISIYDFRHFVAGYLLTKGYRNFKYVSAQDYFDQRMDNQHLLNYFREDVLVIDFVRVPPNKALPLYIMQLCEERRIRGLTTWMISSLAKNSLAVNFKESADDFLSFLEEIPVYVYKRESRKFLASRTKQGAIDAARKSADTAYLK